MHYSIFWCLSTLLLYDASSCLLFRFDVVMSQMKAMALDVQHLLAKVRDRGLLKEVENLTRSLTQASDDLRLIVQKTMALIKQHVKFSYYYIYCMIKQH